MKTTEQAIYKQAESLGGIEVLNASYRTTTFPRHVHEGYCISLIEKGSQIFFRDGEEHLAPEGSIVLVNSDQVHTGRTGTASGWQYRAIYPTPADLTELMDEVFGPGHLPWFIAPVIKDPRHSARLRSLLDSLEESDLPLRSETLYQDFLRFLVKDYGIRRPRWTEEVKGNARAVEQIKDYLNSNFREPVCLDDLVNVTGLNKSYLTRLFTRHAGIPPHTYLIQIRIRHAKQLLRQGWSLADVAITTGFTDQSHLSRHFQRSLGVSPGRYLRSIQ